MPMDLKRAKEPTVDRIGLAILGCLIGAGLLAGIVWVLDLGGTRQQAYVRGHRKADTHAVLQSLAIDLSLAVKFSGEEPPKDVNAVMTFIKRYIPAVRNKPHIYGSWLDKQTGSLLDAWENRVRLVVESAHNYRFISAGPNGRYEDGKADDIVYDFDPWKLAEADEQETMEDQ